LNGVVCVRNDVQLAAARRGTLRFAAACLSLCQRIPNPMAPGRLRDAASPVALRRGTPAAWVRPLSFIYLVSLPKARVFIVLSLIRRRKARQRSRVGAHILSSVRSAPFAARSTLRTRDAEERSSIVRAEAEWLASQTHLFPGSGLLHGWLTQPNLLCEMVNEAETCAVQTSAG
jgi:hypothetical protein